MNRNVMNVWTFVLENSQSPKNDIPYQADQHDLTRIDSENRETRKRTTQATEKSDKEIPLLSSH